MTLFKGRAFSGSAAAMMMCDRDMKIVDYNPALKEIFNDNIEALQEELARLRSRER